MDDDNVYTSPTVFWERRQEEDLSRLLQLLKETGNPDIIEAVKEAEDCDEQMKTEQVCRDPRQMQILEERLKVICSYLEGALTVLPGGTDLLGFLDRCKIMRKLMMTLDPPKDRDRRPASESNLSFTARSSQREKRREERQKSMARDYPLFMSRGSLSYTNAEGSPCPICLEEFGKRQFISKLAKCGHVYHTECMDRWVHIHNACPLCRAPVL